MLVTLVRVIPKTVMLMMAELGSCTEMMLLEMLHCNATPARSTQMELELGCS